MMKYFSMSSFVAGVMLGALLTGAWFFGKDSVLVPFLSSSFNISTVATSSTPSLEESTAVSVTDQISGEEVLVESVTVPPPGVWVAVREMNGNNLGNVLGALRVDGPRSFISIPLLRATVSGRSYAVELYRDDGNGVFDTTTNSVYVDFNTGAPVIAYFMTTQ